MIRILVSASRSLTLGGFISFTYYITRWSFVYILIKNGIFLGSFMFFSFLWVLKRLLLSGFFIYSSLWLLNDWLMLPLAPSLLKWLAHTFQLDSFLSRNSSASESSSSDLCIEAFVWIFYFNNLVIWAQVLKCEYAVRGEIVNIAQVNIFVLDCTFLKWILLCFCSFWFLLPSHRGCKRIWRLTRTLIPLMRYVIIGLVLFVLSNLILSMNEAYKVLCFWQIIYCNIGNPQSLGQQPITFFREVNKWAFMVLVCSIC